MQYHLLGPHRFQAGDIVERIDGTVTSGMDTATVRYKLEVPRCMLRLWRPATNAVFELDAEVLAQHALSSAQRNPHHQQVQQQQQQQQHLQQQQHQQHQQQQHQQQHQQHQQQQQYGKRNMHWQQDESGLM
jgi:hypothetical protein